MNNTFIIISTAISVIIGILIAIFIPLVYQIILMAILFFLFISGFKTVPLGTVLTFKYIYVPMLIIEIVVNCIIYFFILSIF